MSSQAYADRLARSLESTGLLQAVNSTFGESQVRVLCRALPGSEQRWVNLVHQILLATEAERGRVHSWQAHICRLYFLKQTKTEDKLVFGWNVSIQSQDLPAALDVLTRVIRGEAPDQKYTARPGEVEEMEFTGVVGERVPNSRGKGGYPVGGKDSFRIERAGSGASK